jgi:hypothetical protein
MWDREFTMLIFGLEQWKHLLAHTEIPIIVYLDHANLAYYRHPQKINRCVTRGINALSIYNFQIIHKPGVQNHADALSHRPDYPMGQDDNQGVVALPSHLFVKAAYLLPIHEKVLAAQERHASDLAQIAEQYSLESNNHHWTRKG